VICLTNTLRGTMTEVTPCTRAVVNEYEQEFRSIKPDDWDVCAFQARVFATAEKHKQYLLSLKVEDITDELKQISKDLRKLLQRLPNTLDTYAPVVNLEQKTVTWGDKTYRFVCLYKLYNQYNRIFDGSTFVAWSFIPKHVRPLLLQFLTPISKD